MTALTLPAVLALAAQCAPGIDPYTVTGYAQHESGLRPDVVHTNRDGSTDWGLGGINIRNFGWLGLTKETALDPCRNIQAIATFLKTMSFYNTGSPTRGFGTGYVRDGIAAIDRVKGVGSPASQPAVTLSSQIVTFNKGK